MINESSLIAIVSKIREFSQTVNALMGVVKELEGREGILEKEKSMIGQKEKEIRQLENTIKSKQDELSKSYVEQEAHVAEVEQKLKILKHEEEQRDTYKAELVQKDAEIEQKKRDLQTLIERENAVKQREAELKVRGDELDLQEAAIRKEIEIDRDRKIRLSILEKEIAQEKERVKKYLNI